MHANTHRIRRLRLVVRSPSTEAAFSQRQALRGDLESALLPALGRAFDEAVPGDRVLRIPRLELGVRFQDGAFDTGELSRLIEEGIREALAGLVGDPDRAAAAEHTRPEEARHTSSALHRRMVLLEYLASGRLAWEAGVPGTDPVLMGLKAEAEALAAESEEIDALLVGTLEARFVMAFRWLQLLPHAVRAAVVSRQARRKNHPLALTFRRLSHTDSLGEVLSLRAGAMLFALRDEELSGLPARIVELPAVTALLADCLSQLPPGAGFAADLSVEVERLLGRPDTDRAIDPADVERPGSIRTPAPSRSDGAAEDTRKDTLRETRQAEVVPKARTSAPVAEEIDWRMQAMKAAMVPAAEDEEPGSPVGDAGVILVHPLLPRLFEAVGITEGRVLPEEHLPRAAALLHWVATGRQEVFEFELSVIKLLVGISPTDPLPVAEGLLKGEDFEEGEAMLAAVGRNWTALRNTSIDGLRSSFLQRRGLLSDGESGWRLRVETAPYDMLLDRLPWAISIVKTPWMDRPIFTEWPTP